MISLYTAAAVADVEDDVVSDVPEVLVLFAADVLSSVEDVVPVVVPERLLVSSSRSSSIFL